MVVNMNEYMFDHSGFRGHVHPSKTCRNRIIIMFFRSYIKTSTTTASSMKKILDTEKKEFYSVFFFVCHCSTTAGFGSTSTNLVQVRQRSI